jgi:sugar/nucleoside kinase (ribokinase family)
MNDHARNRPDPHAKLHSPRLMPRHDLVVLGDCNPDLLLAGDVVPRFGQAEQLLDVAEFAIGGSGAIVAAGAARLGLRVALVAVVGDDAPGQIQLAALRARGVDLDAVVISPELPTGLSVILSTAEDRAILTRLGAIAALRAEAVDRELVRGARHLHVSSYFLQVGLHDGLADLLAEAREAGAAVSLDTNWDPAADWDGGLRALLPLIDCLLPNGEEAQRIGGVEGFAAAADELASLVPTVAIKLGAAGGMARSGPESVECPAPPTDAVDTTGAGDSFDAGFIAGRLHGFDLARCLALAVACGSLSTRARGLAVQPTLDEAERTIRAAAG